jgi:hypothetical protein
VSNENIFYFFLMENHYKRIIGNDKINTPNPRRSSSWLGTGTPIKMG